MNKKKEILDLLSKAESSTENVRRMCTYCTVEPGMLDEILIYIREAKNSIEQ